jgi:lambda family phage portal protein
MTPVKAYYEAAKYDPQRKQRRELESADSSILRAGTSIREQARHLDENHDITVGALNTLEQNIVGPQGITVEPLPRRIGGGIHEGFASEIMRLYDDWAMRPEVTHQLDFPAAQRLACRTWLRDGEFLTQKLAGSIPSLDHGSIVPFSLELIEPDFLPLDLNSYTTPRIVNGVEVNAWGRPVAYHVYKHHPGDFRWTSSQLETKRVFADKFLHTKMISRLGQLRGMSILSSVIMRLDDLKDYEESERIAAKVAASMAAFIKKGSPDVYENNTDEYGNEEPRSLRFRPGMVFDDLRAGEEIEVVDTKRPNTSLEPHRNGQLRAAAGGFRITYSSLSRDYNGTYSAQRQELVEAYGGYGILADSFISQFVRPVFLEFLKTAITTGGLIVPKDVDHASIGDALFIPPQMPWIDPLKEAEAWALLDENDYASGPEIIRKRGQSPIDVLDQSERWKAERERRGLISDGQGQLNLELEAQQNEESGDAEEENAA